MASLIRGSDVSRYGIEVLSNKCQGSISTVARLKPTTVRFTSRTMVLIASLRGDKIPALLFAASYTLTWRIGNRRLRSLALLRRFEAWEWNYRSLGHRLP